jgi:hypothetical protein
MRSEHGIINIKSAAFSGCVCPISIPRGGDSGLFPKLVFEGFFLEDCYKYSFDTIEGVQRFGFKNKTRCTGEIKPIHLLDAGTVILLHSNMGIYAGTDGY